MELSFWGGESSMRARALFLSRSLVHMGTGVTEQEDRGQRRWNGASEVGGGAAAAGPDLVGAMPKALAFALSKVGNKRIWGHLPGI